MYASYPAPVGYYGAPPILMVPPQYAQQIVQLSDALWRANTANWQLQQRLEQRQIAEDAYSSTTVLNDDCTYTVGKVSNPLLIMNTSITQAFHVIPEPPYDIPDFYCIRLANMEKALVLDAEHYESDRALLTVFRECPSVEIRTRRSSKTTAELLRTAVSRVIQHVHLDYYAGWCPSEDNNIHFTTFAGMSTHRSNQGRSLPCGAIPLKVSASAAATATRKFCPIFAPVCDRGARWLLFLWFHAAALYSLLEELSFPLPLGLRLFTATDTDCATYLKALLNWYGDSSISLNMPCSLFNNAILSRKDQPLFILDEYRSSDAKTNAAVFSEVLLRKQIPWLHSKKTSYLPLRAMPVILSGQASSLSCTPELLLMELTSEKFDREAWISKIALLQYQPDYLTAFLAYTEVRVSTLESIVHRRSQEALTFSYSGLLNEPCMQLLGILAGLDEFLRDFYEDTDPESIPLIWGNPIEQEEYLLSLLEQTSEREQMHTSVAQDFIEVVRSHIRAGLLTLTPLACESQPTGDEVVYFDQDHLCFTAPAFRLVCQAISQSRPDVLRALGNEGTLCGAPINPETRMTRISIYNVYGKRNTVPVYKLKRSAFESFGDPLLLEGEVDV